VFGYKRIWSDIESEAISQRANLVELHALDKFAVEIAVLLMDNGSSNITSDMIRLLTEARACVIIFLSHTTEIFQVFDVPLFAAGNQCPRSELPFGDEELTVEFRMKGYHGFKQITVDSNT
jgi:hypothetical protein